MLTLLPMPKSITPAPGRYTLPPDLYILLSPNPATRDLFAAERFVIDAEPLTGTHFHITLSDTPVLPEREIRVSPDPAAPPEGYTLAITPAGITLTASTPAGTFYAFQTLLQLLRQAALGKHQKLRLPCLTITDSPDFPRRGFYHDTARGKIPTVDTLLQLIDDLGHLKYNEFQLYIENNFEFRKHPQMYDDTTPYTAEELLLLDSACRARHIDFVPSLTSLGHFDKILRRPAFRHLAEAEPEDLKKAGIKTWSTDPWTLNVTDPAARQLLKDMYDEFVPNFRSDLFNICCDESWDLGKGRSKETADKIGVGQLYVDWVNYCNTLAHAHGKRIQMWGDIILNHPDLIPQLPKDATLLEWGYESHHAFDDHCATFAQRIRRGGGASQQFYVAPGTASWLSLAGRSRNALGNIHNAATAGLKHGATGLLLTDWGDNGHQQFLAVSLLPLAYGAAAGWNVASLPNPAITTAPDWKTGIVPAGTKASDRALAPFLNAASLHLFQDPSLTFATLLYDLGLTYERFRWQRFNGSVEWFLFREKWDATDYLQHVTSKDLDAVTAATERLFDAFQSVTLHHPHADILKAECLLTCEEILHTCRRTHLRLTHAATPKASRKIAATLAKEIPALRSHFSDLWLARNKRSRLDDVLAEFDRLATEYKRLT